MSMGKVLSFCNQKGGTGKTTSLINVAAFLALAGRKVLVIDLDPQANATSGLGVDKNKVDVGVYEALYKSVIPQKAIFTTDIRYLYIMPAKPDLAGAEIEFVGADSREYFLSRILDKVKDNFDFILIDSPPSLSLLTLNALCAAQGVVIPIQCEYYALEGLSRLLDTVNLIKERLNSNLEIEGIILTMADFRTRLTLQVIDEVKRFFPDKAYKTIIPRNVRLSEAPSFGKPIVLYDKHCIGARAYFNLTKEILKQDIQGVYDGEESAGQRPGSIDPSEQRGQNAVSTRLDFPSPGEKSESRIHLY